MSTALTADYQVDGTAVTVVLPLPVTSSDRIAFAGRAAAAASSTTWHGFRELHAAFHEREATTADGAEFGRVCDPFTQVAAAYGVVANLGRNASERFLDHALACFDRIPAIGRLLRDGLMSAYAFGQAALETADVVDTEVLAAIDAEAATRLRRLGGLSVPRVAKTVRAVVLSHDPDAAHQAREAAKAGKNAALVPLDVELSRLVITASAEDATLSMETINAVIAGVCASDPRTKDEQRSDAALARVNGTAFTCQCGRDDCDAELSDTAVAGRCATIVVHVVARKETLDGSDDTPAYLDGFGPISAEHAREIAARDDAVRRDVDVEAAVAAPHQSGDEYRPTAACEAVVRGVFGTCSWPGCDRAAWKSDVDHVCEFNHDSPTEGGATCPCNLNPKCRFHHLLKTFGDGWVDAQFVDADGVIWTEVTTPDGFTVRQQALNNWLIPELGLLPCRHGPQNSPGLVDPADEPRRTLTRAQSKHRARAAQRAANRRARLAEEAAYGEPPF